MNELPKAYVVHALPGRLRVRVPDRKGDADFFASIENQLASLPSVSAVASNPLTGSVLVNFSGDVETLATSATALLSDIQLQLSPPPVEPMLLRVRNEFAGIDTGLREMTGGEIDARAAAFIGLILISAAQLARGNVLAPAATLLWYASDLARSWRPADDSTNK